ncbi:MAG: NUDIX hydrolase [Deltaproteobacteria bacterium]|nr:NUDIX hydrolase [Deltaproteobacteria bacterium]
MKSFSVEGVDVFAHQVEELPPGQHEAVVQIVRELEGGDLYLGDVERGEIQITGIRHIVSNKFWTEVEHEVLFPGKNGKPPTAGTYRSVRWNVGLDSGTAALCVTSNGRVVLTRSFRHAARGWRYEIPRGVRRPGETFMQCGFRESLEEAGIQETDQTQVVDLGMYEPDTGVLMQKPRLIAYTKMVVDPQKVSPDVSEAISGYMTVSVDRILDMIDDGFIVDGYTQAAVLRGLLRGILSSTRWVL